MVYSKENAQYTLLLKLTKKANGDKLQSIPHFTNCLICVTRLCHNLCDKKVILYFEFFIVTNKSKYCTPANSFQKVPWVDPHQLQLLRTAFCDIINVLIEEATIHVASSVTLNT